MDQMTVRPDGLTALGAPVLTGSEQAFGRSNRPSQDGALVPHPEVTATLAGLAASARPSAADRARARVLLADYLAVAGAGASADSAVAARNSLLNGSGGPVTVFGASQTAATRDAALLNGISAHSLELDDTHEPSSSHPGTVIWTALLAVTAAMPAGGHGPAARAAVTGAGRPVTTGHVLDSAVVGYQVMASLGELLGPAELYAQGLHPTAVCGVFGAAAAVGRLSGLPAGAVRQAFGIALSMSAGSMAYLSEGAWTKRFHSGSAAAAGILAADLAAGGFSGPMDAFGDPHGLMQIYGGARPEPRVHAVLGRATGLPAVHETSVKFHPCCRYMHGVMDLLAAYRGKGGRTEGLARIDCGVLSGGMSLVGEPLARKRAVASMVDAQFSMPFGAALVLRRGTSSLSDFEHAAGLAAELRPWLDITEVHTSEDLDAAYPAQWGAEVTLTFTDGQTAQLHTPAFRGSPGWPVGRQELAEKAAGLLGESAATRLLAGVEALGDDEPFDSARLAGLCQAQGAGK
jgi:2-methylcitrate dehydratase PrpD